MLALIATLATLAGPTAVIPSPAQVLITLNGGDYEPGDRVRVEVEVSEDGYLTVFRVDGDGYVRVLFPLDPDLDQFVQGGGGRYELRGRSRDESFFADDRGGTGLVFAVIAREPLSFDGYAIGDHWDYQRLRLPDPAGDIEAQLIEIATDMADNSRFAYDVVGYRVWGPGFESEPDIVVAGGSGYYGGGWDPYYDPYWACIACGWGIHGRGYSSSFRLGFFDPYYDPYYYGRSDWRYGGYGFNGFFGWDPYWGTPYRPITVINTPRRPVAPNPAIGYRSRPRQLTTGGGTPLVAPRTGTTQRGVGDSPRTGNRPATDERAKPTNGTRSRTTRSGNGAASPRPTVSTERRGASPSPSRSSGASSPTRSTAERSRAARPTDDIKESRQGGTSVERPVNRSPVGSRQVDRTKSRPSTTARPSSSPPPRTTGTRPTATPKSTPRSSSARPTSTRSSQPRTSSSRPSTSRSAQPRTSSSRPSTSRSAQPRSSSARPTPSRSSQPRASSQPTRSPSPRASAPRRSSPTPSASRSSSPQRSSGSASSSSSRSKRPNN